jgi:hypothetical protein
MGTNEIYDSHFLPSIFRFPFYNGATKLKFPKETKCHLAGIRILQLVDAHSKLNHEKAGLGDLFSSDLAHILEQLFDYPFSLTISLIEEFGESELLFLRGMKNGIPAKAETYVLDPLPKLTHILRNSLFEISYLNLAAMRIPLSINCLDFKNIPYFRASSIEKEDLSSWVGTKIVNSLSVYRLVSFLNYSEMTKFKSRIEKINKLQFVSICKRARDEGMFELPDKMKVSILRQANKMIKESDPLINSGISQFLNDYFIRWCR